MLSKIIYNFANKNNMYVSIGSAEKFEYLREPLKNISPKLKSFVENDIEKRINPSLTLEGAKSIISCAVSYNIINIKTKKDNKIRGIISNAAIGEDYHNILKNKMKSLCDEISLFTPFEYKIFTDTGPLCDREVARRSNLGFIGKNTSLIIPNVGGKIFLGYIITNLELEYNNIEIKNNCHNCNKCIKVCPTGALSNTFYPEKCISYLTQSKELLSYEDMKNINKQLYGCDLCQNVCPYNKKSENSVDIDICFPQIEKILNMSNKEFKTQFGFTAAGWRGKKIIQRNAVAILGNYKILKSLDILNECLKDKRELIRNTAVRSITNLGFKEGIEILETAYINETNENIKKDIKYGIKMLKGE